MKMEKRIVIAGMARSGQGCVKLLNGKGFHLVINDMKPHIDGLEEALSGCEYENKLGVDPMDVIDGADMLILSPVIPVFKPFAKKAQEQGTEVIGELELGYRYMDKGAKVAAISGTNGKTTSTTLLGEISANSGTPTHVGGNIGIPFTEIVGDIHAGDNVVLEVAALQLETTTSFRPNVAGMINISEDHINRFGSMENYVMNKERLFIYQTEEDYAVLNYDDPVVKNMARLTKGKIIYFSQKEELKEGMFVRDDVMIWRYDGKETEVINIHELIIPGRHNVENALCCCAMAFCMGIDAEVIRKTLRSFKGVEHRIEFVRELNGIQYYNDSKGTNPDSTIRAVEAMSRPTVLILGVGEYDKQSDFTPLFRAFGDTVKAVVASGINVPAIMNAANRTGFRNIYVENSSFEAMIRKATELCEPGYSVLLSPAAASWGMFTDYEERGRVFKDIVRNL